MLVWSDCGSPALLIRFPKDVRTYGIDKQFLWGKSLLVTPVLDPGVDYVVGYFPEGLWYDYYTVRRRQPAEHAPNKHAGCVPWPLWCSDPQGDSVRSKGEEVKLHAPLDKINLHLREGSVTPTQVKSSFLHRFPSSWTPSLRCRYRVQTPNLTLWLSSGQPLHLVSALSDDGSACGDLFWDDGESIDTYESSQYAYIVFSVAQVLNSFSDDQLPSVKFCPSHLRTCCRMWWRPRCSTTMSRPRTSPWKLPPSMALSRNPAESWWTSGILVSPTETIRWENACLGRRSILDISDAKESKWMCSFDSSAEEWDVLLPAGVDTGWSRPQAQSELHHQLDVRTVVSLAAVCRWCAVQDGGGEGNCPPVKALVLAF